MVRRTYKKNRRRAILQLLLLILIVVLLNIACSPLFYRVDLTKEKRFSLSEPTKELLRKQRDIFYVDIYLAGNLTPNMKQLQQGTIEMLNSFRNYAHDNIQYAVSDPFSISDQNLQNKFIKSLQDKNIYSIPFFESQEDEASRSFIFPFALITYHGRSVAIPLVNGLTRTVLTPDFDPSVSISLLEYKFSKAIHELSDNHRDYVGFLDGEGEADTLQLEDIAASLNELYKVSLIDLPNSFEIDTNFKVVIIAKPTIPFTPQDKYKIDQYIMHGGNVLWLIDPVIAGFDSLRSGNGQFMAVDYNLNLIDQMIQYGARVNSDIIEDKQCTHINVPVANSSNFIKRPWPYNPVLTNFNKDNPITKNLDAVEGQFVSTVDTTAVPGIRKTILLTTSSQSRFFRTPVPVNFNIVDPKYAPTDAQYDKPYLPVAVLLEGDFPSAFRGVKPKAEELAKLGFGNGPFLEEGKPARQIVIGDGDMILNNVDPQTGKPDILGVNYIEKYIFGNKDFIMNCVEYLSDNSGLIETRAKEVKLRPLDDKKVKETRTRWQVINILAPLFVLYLFSGIYNFIRIRKYAA